MSVSHAHVSNLSCDPWRTSWARRDFLCHHRETFSRCVWLLEMEIIWGLCSKGGGAGWGNWSATGKSPLDSTLLLLRGCPTWSRPRGKSRNGGWRGQKTDCLFSSSFLRNLILFLSFEAAVQSVSQMGGFYIHVSSAICQIFENQRNNGYKSRKECKEDGPQLGV